MLLLLVLGLFHSSQVFPVLDSLDFVGALISFEVLEF